MRSAVAFAALAVGAFAVPHGHLHHKRAIATDVDVVIKTDVVYVTAIGAAPTTVAVPVSTIAKPTNTPVAHGISEHQKLSEHHVMIHPPAQKSSSSQGPSVVIVTQVETPDAPSSTAAPPAPAPTSASSSVEVKVESSPAAAQVESSPAAAPAPAPAPASSSSSSQDASATANMGSTPTSYQEIVVYHHNLHRRNHSAPDIQWSDNLALSAGIIASSCDYNHNTEVMGGGYGQNIAAGVDASNVSSIITDLFYNGEEPNFSGLYGQAQPSMLNFGGWGHFSQLVWKATTQVGCATQYCPQGLANTGSDVDPYFTVCNYDAVGNMANEYGANIGSPLGLPTAQWNTGL